MSRLVYKKKGLINKCYKLSKSLSTTHSNRPKASDGPTIICDQTQRATANRRSATQPASTNAKNIYP